MTSFRETPQDRAQVSSNNDAMRDLTPVIMQRLGYVRQDGTAARRSRRRRAMHRATLIALMIVAGGFSYSAYVESENARRPDAITVPAALNEDIEQHENRLKRAWRFMRTIAPAVEESRDGVPADDDAIVAIGPMRWI